MMTADRHAQMLVRDRHYWMGILIMFVNKQSIKNIQLANCCVGEAEPDKLQWRDDGEGETLSRPK